ncbi:DUF4352 domain-containing protein [Streptomyces sp. DASNCL29]|uniref:DUF4352 domain-containing protein n=1 Tax=Streptomyces sp. DASNCL29 TaxID=2583819 RepID=UPI00110F7980|nr:DUF4352 domain-containing protein [Streptomyces sp. DASNCL29]TMU98080.1 DUF4352 domain-containing protein [Streptomyces sp. DASNCL29]
MKGNETTPAPGARREGHAPAAPDPAPDYTPRRSAMAEGPATIENCAEDYASGATARASIDRHTRNEVRRLGRGTTALAAVAALTALALTGCSTDSGDTAKRVVEAAEPTGADPSTPDADVPADEPTEDDTSPDALGLGDTAEYDGGVKISLGKFTRGTSGPYAAPENMAYIRFNITFKNTGDETADLNTVSLSCQRAEAPGEEIFDSEHGLDGLPMTHLLPGRSVTAPVACSLPTDESYLQVEVSPGLADTAVFSGHIK